MVAKITFFPVGNGDMTLVRFAGVNPTSLMIDVKIRKSADDETDDETRNVASDLRERLQVDVNGRPYVDAFLLSHPDEDHCLGLSKHFWLGPLADYPDDTKELKEKRIVIREMWSSPMIFRRRSKNHTLCADAQAWNAEARRRVRVWKSYGNFGEGDRILVMGEDQNGKTDDLGPILIKQDEVFSHINGLPSLTFSARLLAPMPSQNEETEEKLSKNESSVILSLHLKASVTDSYGAKFLTGGDAGVFIWERIWNKYNSTPEVLSYDLLLSPHHCSWHSLSYYSWSDYGERALISDDARSALSQAEEGAFIISSSKAIHDDDNDPPCIRAFREYKEIVDNVEGDFYCTGEYPSEKNQSPLEFEVSDNGLKRTVSRSTASVLISTSNAPRAGWHE
ncbi:metallohydrolase [Enterobacteriaceae bacterium RIT711]|nr:metallohydrolase [Enterobacteriaceae bacterium RIT711]